MEKATAKVAVSVRMDAEVRDEFQRWAAEERRSLGNYLEALFMQERERRLCGDVTLESLSQKMDYLISLVQVKPKRKEDTEMAKVLALDCRGVVTEERWKEWVIHLARCGMRMNKYVAEKQMDKLVEIDRAEWDCNVLIDELIKEGAKSLYVPNSWLKPVKSK
jgi:hypothetical protein